MDAKQSILKRLDELCRERKLDELGDIQWSDGQLLRACAIRAERGDPGGWTDFLDYVRARPSVAFGFRELLEELGWMAYSYRDECYKLTLPDALPKLSDAEERQLACILEPENRCEVEPTPKNGGNLGTVMFIEAKPDLAGHARIGRVRFSATRKTIYYAGRKLQSLKGAGFKANYFDVDSGLEYWVSNCKKDGNDTLYPGIVEIDEDAREEYWLQIRKLPANVSLKKFRSRGKHSK